MIFTSGISPAVITTKMPGARRAHRARFFAPASSDYVLRPVSGESEEASGNPTFLEGVGLNLFVNGVRIVPGGVTTGTLLKDSLSIVSELSSRTKASMTLYDKLGLYSVAPGQPVIAYHGTIRIFGGIVQGKVTKHYAGTAAATRYELTCSDWSAITERRKVLVAKSYPAATSADTIFRDIVTNYLDGEGIAVEAVTSSITLPEEYKLKVGSVKSNFDDLAMAFQVEWRIDYYKNLRVGTFTGTFAAPYALADNNATWIADTMSVEESLADYTNTVAAQSSQGVSPSITDTFSGDGSTHSFTTTHPVTSEPAITVNGHVQIVTTIDDLSAAWDFYYTPDQKGVVQNPSYTALTASDALVVTYANPAPNTVIRKDNAEIAARAAIEGGSGKWEDTVGIGEVGSQENAEAIADGVLARFGDIPKQIRFDTNLKGWAVGQTLASTVTHPPAVGSFLITQVSIRDIEKVRIQYTIACTNGQKRPEGFREVFSSSITNINQSSTQTSSGPAAVLQRELRFFLATDIPGLTNPGIQVGSKFGNPAIVKLDGIGAANFYDVTAFFQDAPTGQDIIFDLKTSNGSRAMLLTAEPTTDKLIKSDHRLLIGDRISFTTTGSMPGGLSTGVTYWVVDRAADDFKVGLTQSGAAINITSAGSGNLTGTAERASLFTGNLPHFPAARTTPVTYQLQGSGVDNDVVTIDVYQVGSGVPGANGSVVARMVR